MALLSALACATPARAVSAAAEAPNPPWRGGCPANVVLTVDLSSSMSGNIRQLRKAASDLVDALRGTNNQVALVTFGNEARVEAPLTDVGSDAGRDRIKKRINKLNAGGLFVAGPLGGGTNWEAGLRAAAALRPDLVVMISDGEPNEVDSRPTTGPGATPQYAANPALGAAVNVADGLRAGGVRVVAVGIGFTASSVPNLAAVSGPAIGDDYFTTNADALLRQLYEIASRACGIPVAALPQPLGGSFPLKWVIIGALGGLLLVVGAGVALSRRRDGPRQEPAPRQTRQPKPAVPVIDTSALDLASQQFSSAHANRSRGDDPGAAATGSGHAAADEPSEPVTFGPAAVVGAEADAPHGGGLTRPGEPDWSGATTEGASRPARSAAPDEPDWSGVTAAGTRDAAGGRRSGDGGPVGSPAESEPPGWDPGGWPAAGSPGGPTEAPRPSGEAAAAGEPATAADEDQPAPRPRRVRGRRLSTAHLFEDEPPAT